MAGPAIHEQAPRMIEVLGKLIVDENLEVNLEANKPFVALHKSLGDAGVSQSLRPLLSDYMLLLEKLMREQLFDDVEFGLLVFINACEVLDQPFLDYHVNEVIAFLFNLMMPERNSSPSLVARAGSIVEILLGTPLVLGTPETLSNLLNWIGTVINASPQQLGETLNFFHAEAFQGQTNVCFPCSTMKACFAILLELQKHVTVEHFGAIWKFLSSLLSLHPLEMNRAVPDPLDLRTGCLVLAFLTPEHKELLHPMFGQLLQRLSELIGSDAPDLVREAAHFPLSVLCKCADATFHSDGGLFPLLFKSASDKNVFIQAEACNILVEYLPTVPRAVIVPHLQQLLVLLGNILVCSNSIVVSRALNAVAVVVTTADAAFLPYVQVS
jgi:hypothetical protein